MALLWLTAGVTVLYWVVFFTSGEVHSTEEECYLAFERAFPLADGWMATLSRERVDITTIEPYYRALTEFLTSI